LGGGLGFGGDAGGNKRGEAAPIVKEVPSAPVGEEKDAPASTVKEEAPPAGVIDEAAPPAPAVEVKAAPTPNVEEAEDREKGLGRLEEVQGEGSTEQQTKVNRRVLKKKKRLLTKGTRSDYFDVYGAQARAELVLQPPTPNARLSFQDEHVEEPADSELDEEEEDDYDAADATPADYGEVNKILASRVEDGQTQYLIKWKDDHLESWEPVDNSAAEDLEEKASGEAEVAERGFVALVEEDVAGFEVVVHDGAAEGFIVEVGEPLGDAAEEAVAFRPGEGKNEEQQSVG
jgi:hypothetical protein